MHILQKKGLYTFYKNITKLYKKKSWQSFTKKKNKTFQHVFRTIQKLVQIFTVLYKTLQSSTILLKLCNTSQMFSFFGKIQYLTKPDKTSTNKSTNFTQLNTTWQYFIKRWNNFTTLCLIQKLYKHFTKLRTT